MQWTLPITSILWPNAALNCHSVTGSKTMPHGLVPTDILWPQKQSENQQIFIWVGTLAKLASGCWAQMFLLDGDKPIWDRINLSYCQFLKEHFFTLLRWTGSCQFLALAVKFKSPRAGFTRPVLLIDWATFKGMYMCACWEELSMSNLRWEVYFVVFVCIVFELKDGQDQHVFQSCQKLEQVSRRWTPD